MSSSTRNAILLAVLVVLIGGAAWFFYRGDPEARYTDDASTKTHWTCVQCNKQLDLTAKQFEEWVNSKDKVRRDASKGKQVVFKCPDCGSFTVCRAAYCTLHNVYFAEFDPDGKIRNCPLCEKEMGKP